MAKQCLFLVLMVFVLPIPDFGLLAQYNRETVTEKGFEQSEFFFRSHYLNTFGLRRYRDVAAGLIDDPFLNLHFNPANIPTFRHGSTQVYLDFRGDRTEAAVVRNYSRVYPAYAGLQIYPPPYVDPRWYATTRKEPEPLFSLGIISLPFGAERGLLIGGTYQLIHREEPFYSLPDWIYYPVFGYDAFANSAIDETNIPIVDRYAGEDEMNIQGHLYSAFLGYRLSETIDAGVSLNGIVHSREGEFLNSHRDEYGSINDWNYSHLTVRQREQDYDHLDISGGLRFHLSSAISAGIKAGLLAGDAQQMFHSVDSSNYRYDPPGSAQEWSFNAYNSITRQSWHQDGESRYGRINLTADIHPETKLTAYYRFAQTKIDLTNRSAISDTGFYDSQFVWEETIRSRYFHHSSLSDVRSGTGKRERTEHQAMLNIRYNLTPKNTLIFGIFYSRDKSDIHTIEPVISQRFSEYFHYHSQYYPDTSVYLRRELEDKRLEWRYQSHYWSIQLPVLAHFKLNEYWSMMLGINRILKSWQVEEQTTAYFNRREKTKDGETAIENGFGERYTPPRKKFTENYTDLIASFEAALSPRFKIQLLLDPAFEEQIRIAQWWLIFRMQL